MPAPTYGDTGMTWHCDEYVEVVYDASAFGLSEEATAQSQGGNGGGSGSGSGSGSGDGAFPLIIALFLMGGVGVASVYRWAAGGDGYSGGSGFHGGFAGGGGGHSCACAGCACACACACAGGGRVGCSRKAIGIACLPEVIRSLAKRPPD